MDEVRTRRIYNGTFFHFLFYAQVSTAIVSMRTSRAIVLLKRSHAHN